MNVNHIIHKLSDLYPSVSLEDIDVDKELLFLEKCSSFYEEYHIIWKNIILNSFKDCYIVWDASQYNKHSLSSFIIYDENFVSRNQVVIFISSILPYYHVQDFKFQKKGGSYDSQQVSTSIIKECHILVKKVFPMYLHIEGSILNTDLTHQFNSYLPIYDNFNLFNALFGFIPKL